jgi:hypothetical protein
LGLILAERITGRDILPIERVVNAVVMAYLRLVGMV